jgi:HK97 family phage prohead protease
MSGFIHRSTPVDIAVTGDDGRTVEAYAAVFNVPARIRDQEGSYHEVIDPSAFSRAIDHARPQGSRQHWLTGVFYNHGMTLHGESSSDFSVPIARTVHVEADTTGVLTVSRYADTQLGNDVLALIREGVIRAQSFTGRIIRSTPQLRPGQRYRPTPEGGIPTVRRMELGLSEYGPTPVPAYAEAAVVGVRSAVLGQDLRALRALLDVTPDQDEYPDEPDAELPDTASQEAPVVSDPASPPAAAGEHAVRSSTDDTDDEWQREFRARLRTRGIV